MNSLVRLCRLGGCEVAAAWGGLAILWRRGHDWQRPWDGGRHKALVPLTADRCGPSSHSGATLGLKPLVAQLLGLFLFYFYFLMILVCSEKQRYGFYVTGPIGSMWPNVIQIFPEYRTALPSPSAAGVASGLLLSSLQSSPSLPRYSRYFLSSWTGNSSYPGAVLQGNMRPVTDSSQLQLKSLSVCGVMSVLELFPLFSVESGKVVNYTNSENSYIKKSTYVLILAEK